MKPLTNLSGRLDKLKKMTKLGSRSSSSSSVVADSHDGVSGPTPLKAKGKMKARKSSTENLFNGKADKNGGPMRASSLEDIHSLSSQGSSGKGGTSAAKIVDAVVKLYLPDHSHKYIDISPVSCTVSLIF